MSKSKSAQYPPWEITNNWLSVPNISQPFLLEKTPNLAIFSLKAPYLKIPQTSLGKNYSWCIEDVKNHIDGLYPDSKILAINTTKGKEFENEQWNEYGIEVCDEDFSSHYDKTEIKNFGNVCDDFVAKNEGSQCCILLYGKLGINKPGFLISGLLSLRESAKIEDSLKLYEEKRGIGIYNGRAVDALADIFDSPDLRLAKSPFKSSDDWKDTPLGDTEATADHGVNWVRFTRKEIKDSEKGRVIEKLKSALPDGCSIEENEVVLNDEYWNEESLNKIKEGSYLVAPEPFNKQSYIVVTDPNTVYIVSPTMTVYSTLASFEDAPSTMLPLVVACTWVDEHARFTALLTDVLMIGGERVSERPLIERQNVLYSQITRRFKSLTNQNNMTLEFTYRPFATLKNTKRVIDDLDKFCGKPESIRFVPLDKPFGNSIFLNISPTVIFNFEYNGAQKAFLTAYDKEEDVVVLVYELDDPKYAAFHGLQTRFKYENGKLIPISFVRDKKTFRYDKVTTVDEFFNFVKFCESPPDMDKIVNELIALPDPKLDE